MRDLQQGGNAPVDGEAVTISFTWDVAGKQGVQVDPSAYLLTADGRVRGDADIIFYNQPTNGQAIRFRADDDGAFDVHLSALPSEIARVVFCATIQGATAKGQNLSLAAGSEIRVSQGGEGDTLRFRPDLSGAKEAAMTFGELYRRDGRWKFRAVGQGFDGGLAPLARSFGIDVDEGVAPVVAPPETRPTFPPTPPTHTPKPVSLAKVTLEKRQTISLEKKGASFGEIVVNLNWSRGSGGFFGGKAVDLDLGCLFELADGTKQVVQALGDVFGSFDKPPYVVLSGDDRTGDVAQGETLRINGTRWSELKRIVVFANIYDGVPNWRRTDGMVRMTMPNQPPIEVRMIEGRNDRRMCAVVLLENDGGQVKATNVVEYFAGHQDLDRRFGWGLRWVAGRKD